MMVSVINLCTRCRSVRGAIAFVSCFVFLVFVFFD